MANRLTHYEAIKAIVHFMEERYFAYSALIHFGQEKVLFKVSNTDLVSVLTRVMKKEIDLEELEEWAHLLEIRGDIDHTEVEGALYALANPEQMGALTMGKVSKLLALIDK